MSKHTPGPWFVVNVGDEDEPMYTVKAARIAGKEPRHEVALCATGDSPQEMETANAHLIAAAPEMLEALRMVVRHLHAPGGDGYEELLAAERAIAKAEGA